MDICTRISVLLGVEENLLGRVFYARSVISALKNTTLQIVDDLERSLFQIFIAVEGKKDRRHLLLHMAFLNKGI